MSTSRSISARLVLGVLSVAAIAGCSGSTASLPMAPAAQAIVEPDACRNEGAVKVTPCRVAFDASQKGPVSISVDTPHGSKGSVVEHDNCGGASGMAVITGSGNDWSVSAGAAKGHCHVRFNYFNNNQRVGWAVLKVRNTP